jgi:hypothetical protein
MGNVKSQKRHLGVIRSGPIAWAWTIECEWHYQAWQRKVHQTYEREAQRIGLEQDGVFINAPKCVPNQKIRRATQAILHNMAFIYLYFLGLQHE